MYVASNTNEEEGAQEAEVEIPGEGLSNLARVDQLADEGYWCRAGSKGRLEGDCSNEEEAISGTTDSLLVIHVTHRTDQPGTNTTI